MFTKRSARRSVSMFILLFAACAGRAAEKYNADVATNPASLLAAEAPAVPAPDLLRGDLLMAAPPPASPVPPAHHHHPDPVMPAHHHHGGMKPVPTDPPDAGGTP